MSEIRLFEIMELQLPQDGMYEQFIKVVHQWREKECARDI